MPSSMVRLPDERLPRERWLTRQEAARLIRTAWHYREVQKGHPTGRHSRRHVAKFILVAVYTGSRAGAICGASLGPQQGRGWIDLDRGVFYRRAPGKRTTKKRAPPIPMPPGLLAHLRRWHAHGQRYVVEWYGEPAANIHKAFERAVQSAKLSGVTPHTLRHTAATWLMQAGTPVWEAAGYLGMSVEMLVERYGHHHPDHLSGATAAYSRHRVRHRMIKTEREQASANVVKMHGN